ncbi:MAG TPA: hypothetical protein DGR79_05820, partial [Clostridiales bacterium]|nr:hypothetical protein [Clostridiales bacterium]
IAPYMPEYRYRLASMYAAQGRHRDALSEVTEILRWWHLFIRNSEARKAVGHLEDDIYLLAGQSALHVGDAGAAKTYVEAALSFNPENSEALKLLDALQEVPTGG